MDNEDGDGEMVDEAMRRAQRAEQARGPPPDYKPLRCKLGLHHWHHVTNNRFNHILRCALCGETKTVGHTAVEIGFKKK